MSRPEYFARARPKLVEVEERYHYVQEISRNPYRGARQAPSGQVHVEVPYDGHSFFTREAVADLTRQRAAAGGYAPEEALIGHLALARHHRTDLDAAYALGGRSGCLPLRVPVRPPGLPTGSSLIDDGTSCHLNLPYSPQAPELLPLSVKIELLEEDSWQAPTGTDSATPLPPEQLAALARAAQQAGLRRRLYLFLETKIDLQPHLVPRDFKPRLTKLAIPWPSTPSLRTLELAVSIAGRTELLNLRFNAATASLEFGDIPLSEVDGTDRTQVRTFCTGPMILFVDNPADLYQQQSLLANAEVELPGVLLSDLRARLFDGTGTERADVPLRLSSRLDSEVTLILDDAFRRRTRSPSFHLHFEHVVPNEMRVGDLKAALTDLGFRIEAGPSSLPGPSGDEVFRTLEASRPQGPDRMVLRVFLEGKRHTATRQTDVLGGQSFTTQVQSGELRLHILGQLPGKSQPLLEEMTALQQRLRRLFLSTPDLR